MDQSRIKELIINRSTELGFDGVGFTDSKKVDPDRLSEWIHRRFHGEMSYLERNKQKRIYPELVFPAIKSIAIFRWSYEGNYELPYSNPRVGLISKYATGRDYHKTIAKRLKRLLFSLKNEIPGLEGKFYVDTGPVMEKYWAEKAGLGWIGKHTNLINQEMGSWFFLGVLLLNIEVASDPKAEDRCGTCRRCIEACPTRAIVEPYLLDSRRCISYLTIEHREDIPRELRNGIRNLIYGCDICQDVCPWNVRRKKNHELQLPLPDDLVVDLAQVDRIPHENFDSLYKGRAIRRTKWRGLMRNICIAMGNSKDREFSVALSQLLNCNDAMVRRHAAWALNQIDPVSNRSILVNRLEVESDPESREELKCLLKAEE
jgi:epoxyqueuosine reductase